MRSRDLRHMIFVLCLIGVLNANIAFAKDKQMEYYIALNGNDAWAGTKTQPFATLNAARDAIRKLKTRQQFPAEGVTVYMRGGCYSHSSGFTLSAEDSGTPEARVIYRAFPGEQVRLLGGKRLQHFAPVTDAAILDRLDPQARGHVVQVDLRAEGVTDFGKLQSRGFDRPMTPAHLELFFNGKVMQLARWPNEGSVQIAGIPHNAGVSDGMGQTIGQLEAGFHYAGERPERWKKTDDIWVHGYWAWDWANSYEQIASIDTGAHLLKTRKPYGQYGFRTGQRFYFLNILEELDQPGEYYLDRTTGILYFWPPATIEKAETYISLLEAPIIALKGAAFVTVQGITLEVTRGCGITIDGGEQNIIGGCIVRNIGNYGIMIEGGSGHTVSGCDVYATGDGGVMVHGGDRKTLTPGKHNVENNHIHHIGLWSRCYQPGVMVSGVGNRVAQNCIHDGPHNAIQLSGNDHIIEYNDISHVCLETGDVGAFYMGRDWTQLGNIVRYNYFHEIGGIGMGSMAVYLDDCSSGVTIYGNIFYHTQRAAFIGGGRDNIVDNNVFVECMPAVCIDGRGLEHSPVWHDMVYETMRKRLEEIHYTQPPYCERYPKLAELTPYYAKADGVPPEGNVVRHNIAVGGQWLDISWHADAKMVDMHENLVGQDPHFVDAGKQNFQLQDDSPAFALGFKRIPVEQIGCYRDAYRVTGVEGK